MSRPEIYRGDSARRWFAMQTCERVGSALQEFPRQRQPMPSLFLQVVGVAFLFLIFAEIFA